MEKFLQNGSLSERFKIIRHMADEECVRVGRHPEEIALMAVIKNRTVDQVNEAMQYADLAGENRVQELLARKDQYTFHQNKIHFIGSLQTNKVKSLLPHVSMIESLDSIRLAGELQKQAEKLNRNVDCLVEVNISNERAKGGIIPENISSFLDEMEGYPNLKIKGFMTIGENGIDQGKKSENFAKMQRIFIDNRGKKLDNVDVSVLSMGMSEDFLLAIQFGSHILRLGRVLFS